MHHIFRHAQRGASIASSLFLLLISAPLRAEDWAKIYPIREDLPGPYSYEEISKKEYQGVTLRVLTHEVPVMGEPTDVHAKQFEELTGAKVEVTHVPFGNLYQEATFGLKTGKYDMVFFASFWLADLYPHLAPLPETMIQSPQFQDVLQHYKDIAKWGDTYYQVPIDGDRHYLQYRRDLFENPALKEAFQAAHQRELTVPRTWKAYAETAAFFHNKTANGQAISGSVEINKEDDLMFSQFIDRAAAYAKHPNVKGGFYFDLETMTPLINTPGFVQALADFVEIQQYSPQTETRLGLADVIRTFGGGAAAMCHSWDDPFIQAMEPNSALRNQVAAALSPGSTTVWNRDTGAWDDFPNVNDAPYIAWGWTSGVSRLSKSQEAAFDFLGFFSNEANHASDLLVGRYGVNPFRNADLHKEFWMEFAGWSEETAASYVETFRAISDHPNRILDLRIYLGRLYMNALAVGIQRALTGRSTPQVALDYVAKEWESLTKRVGVEKQREAYQNIVRFEDHEDVQP